MLGYTLDRAVRITTHWAYSFALRSIFQIDFINPSEGPTMHTWSKHTSRYMPSCVPGSVLTAKQLSTGPAGHCGRLRLRRQSTWKSTCVNEQFIFEHKP